MSAIQMTIGAEQNAIVGLLALDLLLMASWILSALSSAATLLSR
jgi:hypothetical protein